MAAKNWKPDGSLRDVLYGRVDWRALDREGSKVRTWPGIICARWLEREGFGWYTGLRAPMVVGGEHMPLDPGKPTILTFYIPFTFAVSQSGMPLAEQASKARLELFSMAYRDIERRVRFGHSELTGFQPWDAACDEGERAVRQVMKIA